MRISIGDQPAKSERTKHDPAVCRMSFGRYPVTGCPRCAELANGAEARRGYGRSAKQRRQDDADRSRQIREHDCRKSHCGPVCTAFDW